MGSGPRGTNLPGRPEGLVEFGRAAFLPCAHQPDGLLADRGTITLPVEERRQAYISCTLNTTGESHGRDGTQTIPEARGRGRGRERESWNWPALVQSKTREQSHLISHLRRCILLIIHGELWLAQRLRTTSPYRVITRTADGRWDEGAGGQRVDR